MKPIITKDLSECLTLLISHRDEDGEGGWRETWRRGATVWACVWPLIDKQETASYRIIIRADLTLPSKIGFLWPLRPTKRLSVISPPVLIQHNKFLCMTAKEETHA